MAEYFSVDDEGEAVLVDVQFDHGEVVFGSESLNPEFVGFSGEEGGSFIVECIQYAFLIDICKAKNVSMLMEYNAWDEWLVEQRNYREQFLYELQCWYVEHIDCDQLR